MIALLASVFACFPHLHAQKEAARPKILGLAHIALAAHDLQASRAFYHDFLGFDEVSNWKKADGTTAFTFFKINDRQYIELTPESQVNTDRLGDISFETDDAEAMRRYLAGKGFAVPAELKPNRIGNLAFKVIDPEGHAIEFLQYLPGGQTAREFGKGLGAERISSHMTHAGLIVTHPDAEYRFFVEVLGFRETWRGSSDGAVLSWINLKTPDSADYVEFMLYKTAPVPDQRGGAHHMCLAVSSVEDAVRRAQDVTLHAAVHAEDRRASWEKSQASGKPVRSGWNACRTDGTEHGGWKADAAIYRAPAAMRFQTEPFALCCVLSTGAHARLKHVV